MPRSRVCSRVHEPTGFLEECEWGVAVDRAGASCLARCGGRPRSTGQCLTWTWASIILSRTEGTGIGNGTFTRLGTGRLGLWVDGVCVSPLRRTDVPEVSHGACVKSARRHQRGGAPLPFLGQFSSVAALQSPAFPPPPSAVTAPALTPGAL